MPESLPAGEWQAAEPQNAEESPATRMAVDEDAPDAEEHTLGTQFPVARIKRIMKLDPEVKTVSTETAVCAGIAAELFLQHVAQKAYEHAKADRRKGVAYKDIAAVAQKHDVLDFMRPVVPQQVPLHVALERQRALAAENPQLAPKSAAPAAPGDVRRSNASIARMLKRIESDASGVPAPAPSSPGH